MIPPINQWFQDFSVMETIRLPFIRKPTIWDVLFGEVYLVPFSLECIKPKDLREILEDDSRILGLIIYASQKEKEIGILFRG